MQFKEILYLLVKMQFFYLLLEKEYLNMAETYYFEYFRNIGKECRKNWERKEQSFLKLLKTPTILKNKNVWEKNMDKFMLDLNRSLYNFFYQGKMDNNSVNTEMEGYIPVNNLELKRPHINSVDSIKSNQSNSNISSATLIHIEQQNELCHENRDEMKELSQFSTKEEFSDFEEEIEAHQPCINQELYSNLIILSYPENEISDIKMLTDEIKPAIKSKFIQFLEDQNKPPLPSVTKPINNDCNIYRFDKSSNYNRYHKEYVPIINKNKPSLHKQLPLLQSFKPKYTKRENIDKKILTRFKIYLKKQYKDKILKIDSSIDNNFWIIFLNENLLPPMKYNDKTTNEYVEFKSFNSKFLFWFFNKKGTKEFYDQFLRNQLDLLFSDICSSYKINDSNDIHQLKNYINNIPYIFDLQGISNPENTSITSNENNEHLSKKQENSQFNAPIPVQRKTLQSIKSEKDFDSDNETKIKRYERSREFEFLNFDSLNDFSSFSDFKSEED